MIEAIAWIALGCFFGVFSGLAPGIHVNTIALVSGSLAAGNAENFALMIVAMTITHSFLDFIPSILLGVPDETSFLSALPGHRMLLRGKAFRAIKLTVIGGLLGTIIGLAILPFFALFVQKTSRFLFGLVPIILSAALLLLIATEKTAKKKIFAIIVVALSGALGLLSLQGSGTGNALFALVTGFFGTSTILFSLKQKQAMHAQIIEETKFDTISSIKAGFAGTIASALVSIFPAIGPSHAAFLVKRFSAKVGTENYLIMLGSINTAGSIFSFFVLYLLGKARTGTAVAIKNILVLQQEHLLQIFAAILIAACFGAFATDFIARKAINKIQRVNYAKLNVFVLLLMIALVLVFAGTQGFFLLFVANSIGLLALSTGVKRTNCMAFLIVPTIALYLNFLQQ